MASDVTLENGNSHCTISFRRLSAIVLINFVDILLLGRHCSDIAHIQSSLSTTRLVIRLIVCNAVGHASRFNGHQGEIYVEIT